MLTSAELSPDQVSGMGAICTGQEGTAAEGQPNIKNSFEWVDSGTCLQVAQNQWS